MIDLHEEIHKRWQNSCRVLSAPTPWAPADLTSADGINLPEVSNPAVTAARRVDWRGRIDSKYCTSDGIVTPDDALVAARKLRRGRPVSVRLTLPVTERIL